jgi:uncharacterized cupredoxin-like copper-binding protein
MKKLIRTFATLLIGMALGASTLAAAAPQTVQAVLTKFNIVVNGEKQELKNTPVVIQGSTYLPVREVASLLDADLTFDSKAQKIELNTKGETKVTETVQSTEWVPAREISEKHGVTITMGKEDTIVEYKEQKISFPMTIEYGNKNGKVFTNKENTASIKVENSVIYLGANTLDLLGIQ